MDSLDETYSLTVPEQQSTLRALPLVEKAVPHFGREGDDAKVIPVCLIRPEVTEITPWPSGKTDRFT